MHKTTQSLCFRLISCMYCELSQGTSTERDRSPSTHWKCHYPCNPQTLLPCNFGWFRFRRDHGTAIHPDFGPSLRITVSSHTCVLVLSTCQRRHRPSSCPCCQTWRTYRLGFKTCWTQDWLRLKSGPINPLIERLVDTGLQVLRRESRNLVNRNNDYCSNHTLQCSSTMDRELSLNVSHNTATGPPQSLTKFGDRPPVEQETFRSTGLVSDFQE